MVSRHQNVKTLNKLVEEAELSGELHLKNRKLRDISCCFDRNFMDLTLSDLSYNCLNEIPAEVCQWQCLHFFNLSHNSIKQISYLDHFCFIEQIDLSGNLITHFPPSICNLKTLVVLLLQNNRIVSLPTSIGKLKLCQKLDVSGNNLTNIPVDIGNMSSLKHLDISRNSIYTLPTEIAQLNLLFFNASENELSSIPLTFKGMTELQNVNFDNNPITCPPLSAIKKGKVHMFKLMQLESAKSQKEQEISEPSFIRKRDKRLNADAVSILNSPEKNVTSHQSVSRSNSSSNSFLHNGIYQSNNSDFSSPIKIKNDENKENCLYKENDVLHGSSGVVAVDVTSNNAVVSENLNEGVDQISENACTEASQYENVDVKALGKTSPVKQKSPDKCKSPVKKPVVSTKAMGFPGYAPPIKEKPKQRIVSQLHGDQNDQSHFLEIIKPRKAYKKVRSETDNDISFTMRRKTEKIYEELELLEELRQSIESALKMPLPQDLLPSLADGVVLCHLANHVKLRSIPTIYVPSPAVPKLSLAKARRNVDNFLDACVKIGVLQSKLCTANDIMHGKGLTRIVNTVRDLKKIANRNGNRKESSFSAPSVRIAPSLQK